MCGNFKETPIEDLLAEVFRRGRQFADAAMAAHIGRNARESAFVTRCLSDVARGGLLEERVGGAIAALRDVIGAEIEAETLGYRRVFEGYHDAERGDIGTVHEVPVRSDRGEGLARVLELLYDLVLARHAALDRIRAEQELRRYL